MSKFVDMLPTSSPIATPNIWNVRLPLTNEAIVIPTQVRIISVVILVYIIFKEISKSVVHNFEVNIQIVWKKLETYWSTRNEN